MRAILSSPDIGTRNIANITKENLIFNMRRDAGDDELLEPIRQLAKLGMDSKKLFLLTDNPSLSSYNMI